MIKKEELTKIIGTDNVIDEKAVVTEYSEDMSFGNSVAPDCILRIQKAEDINKVVQLARDTSTPLVPVSSGPPHFRGDTVPSIGGAVIVDLSGMKKIIRIDRTNRVAMFEPGVTFGELIPAVAKEGLRLNMPMMPRKTKSVVASMLEREPVTMPKYQWDISDPMNCIEVVFGTGDMFRTGAAAGPGTLEEQWIAGGGQAEAAGPSAASWYRIVQGAQGTMGIVKWASARCEILPKMEKPFLVGANKLEQIIEMVHWLLRLQLVNECFILSDTNLAMMMAPKGPKDYHTIKNSLPPWVLCFNIAGYDYLPELRVNEQTKDMLELAQRTGLEPVEAIGNVTAFDLLNTARRPSEEPYWKLRYKGSSSDIFFITVYDKIPELIKVMNETADAAGYPASDIGMYIQPVVQGTSCHCGFNLFFNPEDPNEAAKVKSLSTNATTNLMAKGAFFSRPYGHDARMITNRDAATVAALKKVKAILDPNNIMNPGKLCF